MSLLPFWIRSTMMFNISLMIPKVSSLSLQISYFSFRVAF